MQFDGSLIIELFTIIRYWKLAVADTSYLRVDDSRYHSTNAQSWGCAVAKDPQLLCLDIASARTFGEGKTIVGWKAIDPNADGSLSNCDTTVAGGSGFNGSNTACDYTADGETDLTQSEFFKKIIIDMDERDKLKEAHRLWLLENPRVNHDPRFGGYKCGLPGSAEAIERFNDGIVDVFDMTMIAYIIFNIEPFEDIFGLLQRKTPVLASYMSNSIQDHYMAPYEYDEAGFGICKHKPLGRRAGSIDPDAGMHFYNHFNRLNTKGDVCPYGSPGWNATRNSRRLDEIQENDDAKPVLDVNSPYHRRLSEDDIPLTSFVMYLWSRVPDTAESVGGSWYQIAFAPGITPMVIQFYFDGLDAGDTTSQIVNSRTTAQNVQETPINPSKINVRWVSFERSNPELYADLAECYPITTAVDAQHVVYKNALAVRQIGTSSQRPCSFDLYIWIPRSMHTEVPRQTSRRRTQDSAESDVTIEEPCLRSLRDPTTGLCEPVVHIRPGSQFSTPGGFFAVDQEMSALQPREQQQTVTFGGSIATITNPEVQGTSSGNGWWIWVIVGGSIALVLCLLGVGCAIVAYNRYKPQKRGVPTRPVRARTSDSTQSIPTTRTPTSSRSAMRR